eukprot:CAMPEP_0196733886 /NCGR_PEP_ID=MMETSP1091-20130531/12778_1 /TAXON_ID=302021 /ORGANISM="Rhodomonas sp., Strain CCMP768" /LENGTH=145 /DNA_ID=CAMNT_0042077311 /DNA_START=40 /DNA_END=477 /DNA_ORIENTATION=+
MLEMAAAFVPGVIPTLEHRTPCAHFLVLAAGQKPDGARSGSFASGPRRSGFSRNVPEDKLSKPRFIEEDDGAYGEAGKAISKWQRTQGPIYIQLVGSALLLSGFLNYFSWNNPSLSSSALWCCGILTAFLGFALQRGDTDRNRPY